MYIDENLVVPAIHATISKKSHHSNTNILNLFEEKHKIDKTFFSNNNQKSINFSLKT